jgi:hypothetical protein
MDPSNNKSIPNIILTTDITLVTSRMPLWETITGFGRHYQISRDGRVRINPKSPRLIRMKSHPRARWWLKAGQELSQHQHKNGYLTVNLKDEDGKSTSRHIHRLLMLAFHPPTDLYLQVNHKDGDRLNNSFDNLEWVTQQENLTHAWVNNMRAAPSHRILTSDQVKEIRSLYVKGGHITQRSLGELYGVSLHAIHKIIKGKNWKQIL